MEKLLLFAELSIGHVGCSVILKWITLRRLFLSITITNNMRKVTVGTVKKSIETVLVM